MARATKIIKRSEFIQLIPSKRHENIPIAGGHIVENTLDNRRWARGMGWTYKNSPPPKHNRLRGIYEAFPLTPMKGERN